MDLELRLLAGFVSVAEELNFSRAAERLHMTQPALTRQIRQLESLVRAPLFERSTRHVALTVAGEALLEPARRTLASAAEALETVRRAAHGAAGQLRIGLSVSGNFDIAPVAVRAFRDLHQDVEIAVSRGTTAENVARIEARLIDVAFVRTPLERAEGLACLVLAEEPLVVAVRDGHPLAAYGGVARELLAGEQLVIHPRDFGPGSYDLITGYVWPGASDPDSRVAEHRPDEETMVEAVASGAGVAIIFQSRAQYLAIPGVTYRPLVPPLHGELAISWRADDPNPLVSEFTRIARGLAGPSGGTRPA
jgi:DNA-binding transcriptional LysR family regulator